MPDPSLFRALHVPGEPFVIPNPWDIGTARICERLGARALATTSAGLAFSLGRRDGQLRRDDVLDHCLAMTAATGLPISADLEKGWGDSPDSVADTIRDAAAAGLAGCSIEDNTGDPAAPIYDFGLAVARIEAAVEAARALDTDFVLTARAENLLVGIDDLDDTIRRLQAFEAAGADVLYAPALRDIDMVRAVTSSVNQPVNVLAGSPAQSFTLADLASAGVARVSVGSALARVALGATVAATRGLMEDGEFTSLHDAIPFAEIEDFF